MRKKSGSLAVKFYQVSRSSALCKPIAGSRCRVLKDRGMRKAGDLRRLYSDRLALNTTPSLPLRITPFRGEYYMLKPEARKLVRNLIYPVPDPAFPFLGVHFTRMIDGGVECGNAIFAFAREATEDRLQSAGHHGIARLAGLSNGSSQILARRHG